MSEDSNGPVEVCLPTAGPIEPVGRIGVRREPAHRAAYVEVSKELCRYPAILPAYDTLRAWLDDHELAPALSMREIYHPNRETAGPAEHVADIAAPFAPPS
ncbi:hypothetical protein [Nonomuraea sp. NPDC052265]|uniref:hypothetical protein n=1 Tax=Nonomuraea sp. NPDC052265 TaxID=3364374 RepID=UPI0037C6E415